MKPYILGAIFARGGSKGLPGKNIRLLAGKPLIAYAIETAQTCPSIDRVIVSTDSEEIATVARAYGAEVPFLRPAHLANDDSPERLAWQHALDAMEGAEKRPIDVLVSVPTTAPLRTREDVEKLIRTLLETDADLVIGVKKAERSPYFNMVVLENGYARLALSAGKPLHRRQDAPVMYDIAPVAYAARTEYVRRANSLFEGKVKAVIVPPERGLDIDTELDFRFAEFMMSNTSGPS